jgi:transcriptional regulator with XRE-family HTH domain
MSDNSNEWALVADILNRRIAALHLSSAELSRRSGISPKSLQRYLRGEPIVRTDKKAALSSALGWTPGSINRLLNGLPPATITYDPDSPAELRPLSERLAELDVDIDAADRLSQRTRLLDDIARVAELLAAREDVVAEIDLFWLRRGRGQGAVNPPGDGHLQGRVADLEEQVRQLSQAVEWLMARASQDDADVPLDVAEAIASAPRPGPSRASSS